MAYRNFNPQEWVQEIETGLDYRRKFGIEAVWGEMEAIYYNVHQSMANDGPNIIMSTGDSLLSTLSVPAPYIFIKPERKEAVDKAPLLEILDNLLLKELNLREEVDTAELHAYLFGVGILKFGFDSEYGFDPRLDVGGPLRLGFTLSQLEQTGSRRIEHDSNISPGMPWTRAVPPHDIIVPWGTVNLDNCPWIAHRFVRQIDDLKSDPKYQNTERLSASLSMESFYDSYKSTVRIWQPTSSRSPQGRAGRTERFSVSKRGDRYIEFIELYEIHDRRTGKILVIAPGFNEFLRNDINALQIENRLPFVSISFTPRSRSFWTTSDAYYLRAAQMELSDLAIQRAKIRRIAVPKILVDEDLIDDQELAKLMSTDVGAVVKIKPGTGGRLADAVMPIASHPDQLLVQEEEHIRRNAREQVGFSRNQLGEFSGGRKTATEARIVDTSSQRRISRRGLMVKRLYERSIETINGIIFEHWTVPRLIEVLGEDNTSVWQKVDGPGLKSRYSYNVVFTDEQQQKEQRQEALQMYMILSQDPSVDPVALRVYMIDQFNDPAFARIFNADVQNAMRALRLAGGVVEAAQGGQSGGGARLSQGSRPNGQTGGGPSLPQLAPGRVDA